MTPADANPYAPPEAAVAPAGVRDDRGDFFALFVRWEKYRLIYNAILAAETLLALVLVSWDIRAMLIPELIVLAIGANLCFCAGPVLNGYAWWLGFRGRIVGLLLFLAGTLLAVMITAAALVSLHAMASGVG